jgi:hypothetical protein
MIGAPTTGLLRELSPLPAILTREAGIYWPPGLPKLPHNTHNSFSR